MKEKKTHQILVADPDGETLSSVSTRLGARGYKVFEAKDSPTALKYLENEMIDLALISDDMGRIHGRLLIEKIRKNSHTNTIPIILLAMPEKLSELIMSRERGFDDFMIKPLDPFALQLRVAMNISRARQRIEMNALTRLPGNHAIERVIREKIESGSKFSVLYIDINHFKSFNDRYSFEKGDDVIRQTGKLLIHSAKKICGDADCFVGHVGGDDFIAVMAAEYEETFANHFIQDFDRIIPTYYSEADQAKGAVVVQNRRGQTEKFPLMSCSVAACTNLNRDYRSLGEIAQDAAELKSFLKSQPGSHYLRDRRGAPFKKLEDVAQALSGAAAVKKPKEDINPIGQVLLGAGLITRENLDAALKRHLETGQRLGQVLIGMNAVKSEEVGKMLEKRLNVPYVSLRNFTPARDAIRLFTEEFIRSHRVVPLEIAGDTLKLGMCDPFDIKTLDSIERITALKPFPCLTLEDEFEAFLERYDSEHMKI